MNSMSKIQWRSKKMPLNEWQILQDQFAELQLNLGAPENLAMFIQSIPGDAEGTIFMTGPSIEIIEALSPNGWENTDGPTGDHIALLVGAVDPWEYFGIIRSKDF